MRMVFKNADFSKTGIIEPISPKLVQCTLDVLKGSITIGSTESYNRTASENLFKMNRTIIKNTGSTGINFYCFFYDNNKNYIGYSTSKETGDSFSSIGFKTLKSGESIDILNFNRYLKVNEGNFSVESFLPKDAAYYRVVIQETYTENLSIELSKSDEF